MRYFTLLGLLGGFMLGTGSVQAQLPGGVVPCQMDQYYDMQVRKNPALLKVQEEMEARVRPGNSRETQADTNTYTIPVIFHVIHNGGSENVTLALLQNTIKTLNETYNKLNRDTISVRSVFKSRIGNVKIKFVLASLDPNGNCTDGTNRIESEMTTDANDAVKSLIQWDPNRYLNIWVVKSIYNNTGMAGTLAGYSNFPWMAKDNPALDGIVIDYRFLGLYKKTLTHEVGHYLGLWHTFQGSCSTGDQVDDTPPVAEATTNWNTSANTCKNDKPDMLDMIENYMDYAPYSYLFTTGQVTRMRNFLLSYRGSLVTKENLALTTAQCASSVMENTAAPEATLKLYPNPAVKAVSVKIAGLHSSRATIEILDVAGKTLYSRGLESIYADTTVDLNLEETGLTKGVYFVRLNSAGGTLLSKLVVQ